MIASITVIDSLARLFTTVQRRSVLALWPKSGSSSYLKPGPEAP